MAEQPPEDVDTPSDVKRSHPADSTACLRTRYSIRLTPPSMFYSQDAAWNVVDNKSWKTIAVWSVKAVKLHCAYRRVSNFTLHCTRRTSWVSFILHRFCNLFACLNEAGRSYLVIHVTGQFSRFPQFCVCCLRCDILYFTTLMLVVRFGFHLV
jgi:hypothetical protein